MDRQQLLFAALRCVAQLGRALRSGRRGRRFKSCRIDFFMPLYFHFISIYAAEISIFGCFTAFFLIPGPVFDRLLADFSGFFLFQVVRRRPSVSAAVLSVSFIQCPYTSNVTDAWLCPRRWLTVSISAPAARSSVADVCLRSWKRMTGNVSDTLAQ